VATESALNPQTRFGDDCISRISYAETDEKLAELQKVIIDCINELTAKLCSANSIDANRIYEMCIVGNTTMNHIFLKLPVKQLGQAPYKAFSVDARDITGKELPVQINPAGNIHTVENIAGFVGSDITAAAFAANIDSAEEVTLLVDIGTNGEIVLGTKDKLYAASCAAGPALEGARISCGSRAQEGAIEAVVINDGDIDLDVIGGSQPRSICGSGLIDAVAVLLNLGIVDKTGRFVKAGKLSGKLPAKILSRIGEQAGGLGDSDIKHIFLAGAFGNYIRRENAIRIGLLPDIPTERIVFIGNAAASGAQMLLPCSWARALAKDLARKIEYIEIAKERDFTTVYTDSISF